MNICFLTLIDIVDVNERGIYQDLLRKFRDEGHHLYIVSPAERSKQQKTNLHTQDGITILKVRTLNIQKTNLFEKGVGTLMLEHQFLNAIKKYFTSVKFDLVMYSTPPITLTSVVRYIKQKDNARSYLLLKDIFPQNAVDLGMIKKGGLMHSFFNKKEKKLYAISDHIGCMSPANVDFLLEHNPWLPKDRVGVNPNSIAPLVHDISTANKAEVRRKYNIPSDALVFIYGGNIGKPQGIKFLIEALESNMKNEKIFFVIVGGGTEFHRIVKWRQQKQPANLLLLHGMPKNDYDLLSRACDVGLIFLDSRFTIPNFPSRLLSYLEAAMPVIAATDIHTDIGKIIEEAHCGYWSRSGDLQAFNNSINKLLDAPGLTDEMGKNGRRLLMNNYTVDISYQAIMQAMRETAGVAFA